MLTKFHDLILIYVQNHISILHKYKWYPKQSNHLTVTKHSKMSSRFVKTLIPHSPQVQMESRQVNPTI